jgi:hypothetical protein
MALCSSIHELMSLMFDPPGRSSAQRYFFKLT